MKAAMNEAVTASIIEYKKIMDFFAKGLKTMFQRANFKGGKALITVICFIFIAELKITTCQ